MSDPLKLDPDLQFIRKIRSRGGDSVKKCYQCATCSVVCDRSPNDNPFPRKEMFWAQWGLKDRLLPDPDLWLCYQCGDCTVHCPRGAKPGEVVGAIRGAVIEDYAVPRFMGRAMASPKGIPLLLLFAASVVFFLVWWTGFRKDLDHWGLNAPLPPMMADGHGYEGGFFGNFLEHGPVEMIFIGGNLLVFAFVSISLLRFWRDMKKASGKAETAPFLSCVIQTVKEILTHKAFRDCTANKTRFYAHLLVFFGFFAAMATAGLALLDMIILGHQPPIPLWNPIKILGNLSFIMLIAGTLILIYRRLYKSDTTGKAGYGDWTFLILLFTVALTGGLTQLGRNLEEYALSMSYLIYAIHMSAVFCLLWYAPYSKFAHMFYRTLALVFARSIGRAKSGSAP